MVGVMRITAAHHAALQAAKACYLPAVGSEIGRIPQEDLLWAEEQLPASTVARAVGELGVPLWGASRSGYGDGSGSRYGYGSGDGSGSGYGYGSGYGDGDGDGYGSGDGSGYGSGYGDGDGYGSGDGE